MPEGSGLMRLEEQLETSGCIEVPTPTEVKKPKIDTFSEETHLARALFRKGADEIRHCSFSEGFVNPPTHRGFIQPLLNENNHKDQCPNVFGRTSKIVNPSLYSPLIGNTIIRLLALKPGPQEHMIQCSFIHLDLTSQDLPVYEAISYAWGDPSDTLEISCQYNTVQITRNLHDMLKRIRCSDRIRYIWADALCINQMDKQELSQQVSIMQDIYRSAHRVLVWLGNDAQGQAHEAFTLCCTIVEQWRLPPDKPIVDGFAEYIHMISTAKEGELDGYPPTSAEVWDSLIVLFNLPWFRRLWVIQEVTAASSAILLWGNAYISWPLIGLASAWILTKGYDMMRKRPIPSAFNAFLMYALPVFGNTAFKELNFSNLLGVTRGRFVAADHRDRIFSLLGIPTRGIDTRRALLMQPDYKLSLVSIYTEIAIRILRQDKHLRLLSGVQHGITIDPEYPSWVPRWHESAYESFGFRDENSFYANAGELFEPSAEGTFGDPFPTLAVNGLCFAVVGTISPVMKEGELDPRTFETNIWHAFTRIINELSSRDKQYRTTWNAGDEKFVLWRDDTSVVYHTGNCTLFPGKYRQRDAIESPPRGYLGESLLYWRERSMWADTQDSFHSDDADLVDWYARRTTDPEDSERCLGALYALYGRRIFLTEDGTAGLGPQAMQPGDLVCVLYGATVPFVLRRCCWDEGKDRFIHVLVGECFVPGMMQGEVVTEAKSRIPAVQHERFVLR